MTASMAPARVRRLVIEMLLVYVAAPLLILSAVRWTGISLLIFLAPVLLLIVVGMSLDGSFSWRKSLAVGIPARTLAAILGLFAVLGGGLIVFVLAWQPESFLSFPRYRTRLWLVVMIFYPLVSVTAQEIVYRVLFFHRYHAVFAGHPAYAVLANAALFAFGHIYFGSWVTVLATFAGGVIFAWRYMRTGSFWAVWLEHSFYGMLIFTIGLGRYFFTGVPFG